MLLLGCGAGGTPEVASARARTAGWRSSGHQSIQRGIQTSLGVKINEAHMG